MVSWLFSFIYYLYQHFSFRDSLDTTQGIIFPRWERFLGVSQDLAKSIVHFLGKDPMG